MKKEYVFVVWDTLSEKVLCVHKNEHDTCKSCERVEHKNKTDLESFYPIKREKFEIN